MIRKIYDRGDLGCLNPKVAPYVHGRTRPCLGAIALAVSAAPGRLFKEVNYV